MLNYYNIPFNFNHDNLDNTYEDPAFCGAHAEEIPTGNIPFTIHKSLNYIMFLLVRQL